MELEKLYQKIHRCRACPKMEREKALRRIDAVNISSDIFIISESLAKEQLRKSGVNFFKKNGQLGNTGRKLEKLLRKFNRTVYPPCQVMLSEGATMPKADKGYLSVYNTESAQCCPGKINNKKERSFRRRNC